MYICARIEREITFLCGQIYVYESLRMFMIYFDSFTKKGYILTILLCCLKYHSGYNKAYCV